MRLHGVLVALAVVPMLAAPAAASAKKCDGVPRRGCLLPFPNDVALTRHDRTSATGVRVALRRAWMPANNKGVRIAVSELNRSDGFSPGEPIIVHVPSLRTRADFRASGIVPITDMARYRRPAQTLLLLDERTGRRQLVWGELDANATSAASRNLIIHPGRNLVPGRRYVVVLRRLPHRRPRGLAATWDRGVRRALLRARIRPSRVYLAWRFTVASTRSLNGRLLRMRDDAFAQLGDRNLADRRIQGRPPRFAVTGVTDFTVAQNPLVARKVTGTFDVPCYMTRPGCPPGGRLHYSSRRPDALPTQQRGNVQRATFTCNIPRAALSAPSHLALYGHGLLGSQTEIDAKNVEQMGQEHDFTFCATDWYGFSSADVPTAISTLQDLSRLSTFVDRQLQGVLAQLLLGRLAAHPRGLASTQAFAGLVVAGGPVSWDSNSQGAIMGGTTTALAPDWRRAVLGATGIDYAVLLQRSTDFDTYAAILDPAYPDKGQQTLLLSIVQMLWDRAETDGWTHFATTRPPPNTPSHTILMHVAVGDHQVANVQADVEARSIGASIYRPSVAPGRTTDRRPSYGVPTIRRFPFRGSAVVWWDGGPQTPLVPITNTPPRVGADPHSFPRKTVAARAQKATFLLGGGVVDVCRGQPCRTDIYGP